MHDKPYDKSMQDPKKCKWLTNSSCFTKKINNKVCIKCLADTIKGFYGEKITETPK